ncbi:hypothetical protein ABBQ32_000072 [Trebouxia sp. C0010 RCD-2024]
MAATKGLVRVDVVSDTVCPWCFIGKRRLETAIKKFQGQKSFEVRWHPFFLNPDASKEGVNKLEMYKQKFGEQRVKQMVPMLTEVFAKEGLSYTMEGSTGNTLNSHRLIALAGQQGLDKQDKLVELLFKAYFTQGLFINDKQVLLKAAEEAGIEGAQHLLDTEDELKSEVLHEVKTIAQARGVTGVPFFIINDKYQLSGAQDPDTFAKVFETL